MFTPDEIRSQLRAQKIPEHLIERTVAQYVRRAGLPEQPMGALTVTGGGEVYAADDARLEKEVVAAADKQLRALGFIVVNFSQPRATKQTAGIPDRRYYHVGRKIAFWWEAKADGGRQSPAQQEFEEWCAAAGDPYVCGTDQDLYRWMFCNYPLVTDEAGHLVWRTE